MIGTCKDCVYCATIQRMESRTKRYCALKGKYISDTKKQRRCYMTVTVNPLKPQKEKTVI